MELTPLHSAQIAAYAALELKANDVVILNLQGISAITDFFVICSGTSDTHVEGIADAIMRKMGASGNRLWHREGEREADWILLDYVDVVVHVFFSEVREFYSLERLWADAQITKITEIPEIPENI